jgi:hypothetical protein
MSVKNKNLVIIIVLVLIVLLIGFSSSFLVKRNDLDNPEVVIDNLYKAIDVAIEKGDYKCCIEPACTMCYLGHWKFEKGKCFCDDAIKQGNDDMVCPECVSGIEKGLCKSSVKEGCPLDEEVFGGV